MPRPALRTRSKKRVSKALPGGRATIHYKTEIPASAKCSVCGRPLGGIPRSSPSDASKLNKSKKKVSRIYGGNVCSKCLKMSIKEAVRLSSGL
ncbi:50S ribosomal protein L34e [Candidatus Bathyarchaeota archaeon]|nr:50S ribosomal protein L34e [Candidatus Bathyarchaeota archaeon]